MILWATILIGGLAVFFLLRQINMDGEPKADGIGKDPLDFKLDHNSTNWETDRYCPTCFCENPSSDFMAGICSGCGTNYGTCLQFKNRSRRKIWDGSRWIYQYKYPRDEMRFDETYPPTKPVEYSYKNPTLEIGK